MEERQVHDFDWTGWTDWLLLESLDFRGVPDQPGVYVIAANHPIPRVIDTDPVGILDIGESRSLRSRLKDFLKCARTHGTEGHMAGWRFAFFRLARHFALSSLRVRWVTTESKEAAYLLEGRLFLAYLRRHSELPPLNYSFNWSPFAHEGWDLFDKLLAVTTSRDKSCEPR